MSCWHNDGTILPKFRTNSVTSAQQRLNSDPNRKRLFHPILIRFGFTFGTSCANVGSESWIRLRVAGGVHFHNVNGRSFRLKVGTTNGSDSEAKRFAIVCWVQCRKIVRHDRKVVTIGTQTPNSDNAITHIDRSECSSRSAEPEGQTSFNRMEAEQTHIQKNLQIRHAGSRHVCNHMESPITTVHKPMSRHNGIGNKRTGLGLEKICGNIRIFTKTHSSKGHRKDRNVQRKSVANSTSKQTLSTTPTMIELSIDSPRKIPNVLKLLTQGLERVIQHPSPEALQLHVWSLSSDPWRARVFQQKLLKRQQNLSGNLPSSDMNTSVKNMQIGITKNGVRIQALHL